jgi:DNA/RNA endonuclease YhcR with UshA esterase domain
VFFLIVSFACLSCGKDIEEVGQSLNTPESAETKVSNDSINSNGLSEKKRITTAEASINIGREVILTGYVADVTIRSKVSYLNFDNKYPNNTFSGVIFASSNEKINDKVGDLNVYEGKTVELTGTVGEYNGKPQIIINSPEQIKIIK